MPNIAVIGAGVSGLSAAFQLSTTGAKIRVFEKSRGFSGRAASRTKNGCRYDYGANYFKLNCNEVARLLFEHLPTTDLSRIIGDIGTFDQTGKVEPGDPVQNSGAKWTYRGGINTLGKLLVQVGSLDVTRESQITSLHRADERWHLQDETGDTHGPFDAVVLTPPAPQTIGLLKSTGEDEITEDLIRELDRAEYYCQFSVILNYPAEFALPGDHYALINSDRKHPLAWLSHENRKEGHVPENQTLLIAQMAPDWSQDHYRDDAGNIIEAAAEAVQNLFPHPLPRLQWADHQRWRYAHPHTAASLEAMKPGTEIGLFFAGDAFIGKGRLPRAIETGFATARQLREHFGL
jgi:predicted NAD/FAD-dependent oxidoreductase